MKGIILVGGKGSRLWPLTIATHKQLLPVYDKPMIYYSLSTLMSAGIRDVLIITTKEFLPSYKKLLGTGANYGMNISYTYEESSKGIAQAFMLGEDFIGDDDVCLILGDNIFLGDVREEMIEAIKTVENNNKATIFGYKVDDPERFGVIEFDKNGNVLSIEEKPQFPKSNVAQTGLGVYPNDVVGYSKTLKPSARGELEITDLNGIYLKQGRLTVQNLDDKVEWLDAGTKDSLIESSVIVKEMEEKTGVKQGSIHVTAYKNGWINKEQLVAIGNELYPSDYGKDLLKIAKGVKVKNR